MAGLGRAAQSCTDFEGRQEVTSRHVMGPVSAVVPAVSADECLYFVSELVGTNLILVVMSSPSCDRQSPVGSRPAPVPTAYNACNTTFPRNPLAGPPPPACPPFTSSPAITPPVGVACVSSNPFVVAMGAMGGAPVSSHGASWVRPCGREYVCVGFGSARGACSASSAVMHFGKLGLNTPTRAHTIVPRRLFLRGGWSAASLLVAAAVEATVSAVLMPSCRESCPSLACSCYRLLPS
jgi:hypothetical protein